MYKELLEKIAKNEILEKGSRQSKMPFNPQTDVSQQERDTVEGWSEGQDFDSKQNMPEMNPNAKKRQLGKFSGSTQTKTHPETGEMMYLMHRGMSGEEHSKLEGTGFNKDYISGWSPNYDLASKFKDGSDDMRDPENEDEQADFDELGYFEDEIGQRNYGQGSLPRKVLSAWIGESQIQHIPQAIGTSSGAYSGENEYEDQEERGREERYNSKILPRKSEEYDKNNKEELLGKLLDQHYWDQIDNHAQENNFDTGEFGEKLKEYEQSLSEEDRSGFSELAQEYANEDYETHKEEDFDSEYESQERPISPSAFKNQQEVMVKPHQLMVESEEEKQRRFLPKTPEQEMHEKISNKKPKEIAMTVVSNLGLTPLSASEVMFSKEEALKAISYFLLDKAEECDCTNEQLEKGFKNALKTGASILALIHGAQYINKPNVFEKPQTAQEKEQSVRYQKVKDRIDARKEARGDSPTSSPSMSDKDQIAQVRIDARKEGQAMYDNNSKVDDKTEKISENKDEIRKNPDKSRQPSDISQN